MRYIKATIILFILSVIGVGIVGGSGPKSQILHTNEILEKLDNNEENKLTDEILDKYKAVIEDDLKRAQDSYTLKKNYYALGIIEAKQKSYDQAIMYLENALEDTQDKGETYIDLDLLIYSALSTWYIETDDIQLSNKYFDKVQHIAKTYTNKEILSEIYYERAKELLRIGYNLDEIIEVTEQAISYTTKRQTMARNYIFLSKLYKLQGGFDDSLAYVQKALDLAITMNNQVLVNKSIMGIADNYYLQGNYSNAIYIYEKLLETGRVGAKENILDIYGYLADSYGNIKDYENYKHYRDLYLEHVMSLDEEARNKELVWMYNQCAKTEMNFGDVENAKYYLGEAERLYHESPKDMYYNMDLYLEYNKNKIGYYKNQNYEKGIEKYTEIYDALIVKGIGTDLKYIVIDEIVKIAYENKDYETMITYLDLGQPSTENTEAHTDQIFIQIDNIFMEKQVNQERRKVLVLTFFIVVMLIEWIRIKNKNNQIKKLNLELDKMRKTDALTSLYNRGYMQEVCEEIIEAKSKISFIMIDIDYFKLYNDHYGHMSGDKVLVKVAHTIKKVFSDDLVFRYGGEEFSVISTKGSSELTETLEILKKEISQMGIDHIKSEVSNHITLSVGVATKEIKEGNDLIEVVKLADENLYKSKMNGRNQYTYEI